MMPIVKSPSTRNHGEECRPEHKPSSSIMERVLADKELKDMLSEEMKKNGVVTASGYHAVLRDFVRSERVVKRLEQSSSMDDCLQQDKDKTEDNASPKSPGSSSAEWGRNSNLHTSFNRGNSNGSHLSFGQAFPNLNNEKSACLSPKKSPTSVEKSDDSVFGGESPYLHKRRSSSSSHSYIFESPSTAKAKPPQSLLQRLASSGLQESFSTLLLGANLQDELATKHASKPPKRNNLAPRRNSQVLPFDNDGGEKAGSSSKPPLETILSGRSLLRR